MSCLGMIKLPSDPSSLITGTTSTRNWFVWFKFEKYEMLTF